MIKTFAHVLQEIRQEAVVAERGIFFLFDCIGSKHLEHRLCALDHSDTGCPKSCDYLPPLVTSCHNECCIDTVIGCPCHVDLQTVQKDTW